MNTPATTISVNSWFEMIATLPNAAPKASDPVSPINTLAGCELYTRNPTKAPTNTKQNTAISSFPAVQTEPHEIIPKAKKAIAERPPARPSKPSVMFTALLLPTKTNSKNAPYNHPKLISIPKALIVGSLPLLRNI